MFTLHFLLHQFVAVSIKFYVWKIGTAPIFKGLVKLIRSNKNMSNFCICTIILFVYLQKLKNQVDHVWKSIPNKLLAKAFITSQNL